MINIVNVANRIFAIVSLTNYVVTFQEIPIFFRNGGFDCAKSPLGDLGVPDYLCPILWN